MPWRPLPTYPLFNITVQQMKITPPVAHRKPHKTRVHDVDLDDEHHWLRDRESPRVIDYLKAENAYTQAAMKHTEGMQEKLFLEMKGRIKEADQTVPVRIGDYFYYSRTEPEKQYQVHCRKKGSLDATEEILLDENVLAQGLTYFNLSSFEVSPDHSLLAYSTDTDGSETFTIRIKDLKTGRHRKERIRNAYYTLEWANDNKTFFYTTVHEAHRPNRLHRHILGADPSSDECVHLEEDEAFFVSIEKTRSRKYLLLDLSSNDTTEVRYLDADQPEGPFRLILKRRPKVEYSVDHRDDLFYIRTNLDALNFRLLSVPVTAPQSSWEEIIPNRKDTLLSGVALFRDFMAVFERHETLRQVRIRDLLNGRVHTIEWPEEVFTVYPGANPEFETRTLRLRFSSLSTPLSVYDYDMSDRSRQLRKQTEVVGGYDSSSYVSSRVHAISGDGEVIPISIVHHRDRRPGGPLYLYGYGAYGHSIDPIFSSNRLSLLDRGFAYAIAHVRGGQEKGRRWYDDGKLLSKQNSFLDFAACARRLIDLEYTTPSRLVISGGSAGGLLVGAVVNLHPELLGAAVARVPFVDVLNTMLDPGLPLTVTEFDEWGDPRDKASFDYIRSYSPYDRVESKDYPDMLVTAGLNDPRVQYWEPAKWVARLRQKKTDENLLLLKTNMGAGHGGASGRYEALREVALEYSFLLDRLDLPNERVF